MKKTTEKTLKAKVTVELTPDFIRDIAIFTLSLHVFERPTEKDIEETVEAINGSEAFRDRAALDYVDALTSFGREVLRMAGNYPYWKREPFPRREAQD